MGLMCIATWLFVSLRGVCECCVPSHIVHVRANSSVYASCLNF